MAKEVRVEPGDIVNIYIGGSSSERIEGCFRVADDFTMVRLSDSAISFEIAAYRDGMKLHGIWLDLNAHSFRSDPNICRRDLREQLDTVIQSVSENLRTR